ncbi:hypothetical protein EBZ37_05680, partial [bacterium]|nr:hypothetical protein [bacterium]
MKTRRLNLSFALQSFLLVVGMLGASGCGTQLTIELAKTREITTSDSCSASEEEARPFSGEGTAKEPFLICNIEQLHYVRFFPMAYFLVKQDIDASATRPGNASNIGSIWEADAKYADVQKIQEDSELTSSDPNFATD